MHTSSPQPIALPDGGEIVELDSSEQKPLVDFDATNNRAYQSSILVSNSEKENTGETSKRRCMTESVLSYSMARKSLTDFNAPDYGADPVMAYHSSSIGNTAVGEGISIECLTKSSDDDSTKRELLPERTSLAFCSEMTSEYIDGFYDYVDSDSDDFDDGAARLPNLKDEFVDGLSSSCGDEQITVSTTNHRDPHDAALLPLVNMDTNIHTASPQPIALPDGGEIVPLESSEQKSLVDFDATNNRPYQNGVLLSSEKKNMIEAYKEQWESLIQRTEKDMGEGLNEECFTKSALSLDDSTEQNSVDPRRGRGPLHSMEHEQPTTFVELVTDAENEGIVSDLLRFVKEEFYKRVDKAWKRGYLLYNPPCIDRSSLIAYMANRLEFEIYNLDLTGLSSIEELTNVLVSINNRSLIAIKDFDQWVGMLPDLKSELTLSGLLEIIHGLLLSCGDERIIIVTTNHNHVDRVYATLLCPLNIDLYIHTSSPQPIAVPGGGEIVQHDSSEQKPLEDFDATNNRAYQSDVLVSKSEEKMKKKCNPENPKFANYLYLTQNWATLKGYSLGDKRPVDVIRLSMDGKLVSRLQLIHISWLGRFSPRPPALPPGGEIVGPPALSSSQLPSASNRAQLVGQDCNGSTGAASHSENDRTTEQEGRKRKIKNLTREDLRQLVGLKCEDAAKECEMGKTTFKRYCRKLGIKKWPDVPTGEILRPPDPPERNTGQIEMVNEAGHLPEPIEGSRPADPRERNTVHLPDFCWSEGNDSIDFQSVLLDFGADQAIDGYPNPDVFLQPPDVFLQSHVAHIVSGNMGIPNDQRNSFASQVETRLEGLGTGSTCSDQGLSQRTLSQTMPPPNQDTSFVTLKVYGLDTIIFKFPLTSGINELMGEVAKRLNLEQDSFNMKYKDEEGEQILIPLSEDLRDYLSSSGKPVIKLWVVCKVANPTNLCGSCGGSLNW